MSCAVSARGKSEAYHGAELLQVLQQVETARAAVDDGHARRPGFALQSFDGVDADALVAHQQVADAEDERPPVHLRSTNRTPVMMEEISLRLSVMSWKIVR